MTLGSLSENGKSHSLPSLPYLGINREGTHSVFIEVHPRFTHFKSSWTHRLPKFFFSSFVHLSVMSTIRRSASTPDLMSHPSLMSMNNNHTVLLASLNVFENVLAATSHSNNIPGVFLAGIAKDLMMSTKKARMTRKCNFLCMGDPL